MIPDFTKYSLALIKEDKIIFSSDKSGLRPLIERINEFNDENNCTLHDKVIGLAAAKLILNSNIIKEIKTNVISQPALDYLKDKISVKYETVTKNILNKEKTSVCPMELKAIELSDKDFLKHIENIFN